MTTTSDLQLGYQEDTDTQYSAFQVSLLGNFVQTYSLDCSTDIETKWRTFSSSCENYPTLAENYFNSTGYFEESDNTEQTLLYGGLNATGYVYQAAVCFATSFETNFCTIENNNIFSIDKINSDNWNMYSPISAGTIGLGIYSPAWQIIGSPDTKEFDVQLTNFVDWTFADSSWAQVNSANEINFGGYGSYSYDSTTPKTTFSTYMAGSDLFQLVEFGFGLTNSANSSEYYENLMNDYNLTSDDDDSYNFWSNTSSLALNYKGLGIPRDSYYEFVNLLAVASNGQSTCITKGDGYCVLVSPCESYSETGLWDYDFKI